LGAWIMHPVQGALDYLVAFLMLAMGGGIARKLPVPEKYKMVCALAIGGALRWAVHTLAGVVFFASNAPEGQPVWAYSAVYNAFLFPEVALASIVSLLPAFARLFKPLREDAV
ncbi:MAG: hypothetical protein GX558_12660, partial [Clostridiales bacterium]|nr:hypothetical protein [Clostridiales bacterium]